MPNSAAARAGLRNGDIILAIGGQRVDSFESLVATLETLTVGDTAPIQIERNGLLRHLTIDLEPWPTSQPPQRIP